MKTLGDFFTGLDPVAAKIPAHDVHTLETGNKSAWWKVRFGCEACQARLLQEIFPDFGNEPYVTSAFLTLCQIGFFPLLIKRDDQAELLFKAAYAAHKREASRRSAVYTNSSTNR